MKEIKSLRKPREKHFLKSDGTMVAYVYDKDVHYFKEGTYYDIDNTIVDYKNKLVNKANNFKTIFNKEDTGVLIEDDNHYLQMKMKNFNNNFGLETKENKVKYNNILKDIDLKYEVLDEKLKEAIVLKNKNSIFYEIEFDVLTNLELVINNKNINVLDKDKVLYIIDAPYMIDDKGNYNNNIYYSLIKNDMGYTIKLVLDKEWLEDPNRAYPVVIDPTITVTDKKNVVDTYISSLNPNKNMGGEDKLCVGVNKEGGKDNVSRTLIKFDLPVIATGSIVTSAYINLTSHEKDYVGYDGDINSNVISDIHAINAPWNEETATWNNMHDKYDPRIEECAYTRKSKMFGTEDHILDIIIYENSFNITNMVKRWYAGDNNYGVMIKKHLENYQENNNNYAMYYSKNHKLTSTDPTPILVINYRNQNGLEDYYSYDEISYETGNSYINQNNGNLTNSFLLANTINGKMPIKLLLYYNTNDFILNNNYVLGAGYKLSLYQTVKEVEIEEMNYLEYLDEDGTLHYFVKDIENNNYYDEDGLGLKAIKENNKYVFIDKSNNKMTFTLNGNTWYLTQITNTDNNNILINYNGNKIIKIVDANEQEININYLEDKVIFNSKYGVVTLNYNLGVLESIDSKMGKVLFNYNEIGLISKIIDIDGMSTGFSYYEVIPYRIKQVKEYGLNNKEGDSFTYNYGYDSTTITDRKGRVKNYCFNTNGSVISTSSLDGIDNLNSGYGKTRDYYTNSGILNNKLLTDNALVKYTKNYISNSSFEEETTIFHTDGENIFRSPIAHSGNYSLRVGIPNVSNGTYASIDVPKGHYYTFSAYIKGTDSVRITLGYKDSNNNTISKTVKANYNEEFTRYDVTIFYPSDATSLLNIEINGNMMDAFYIDDVQLEQNATANYYNMVTNGDFKNGLEGWTIEGDPNHITQNEIVTLQDDSKALMIKADPFVEKSLTKKIKVKGKKNDTYNLSFWYKNTGIETGYETSIYGNYNLALINFKYTDDTLGVEPVAVKLNTNSTNWQFFSCNFTAREDYDEIILDILVLKNVNELYVTNLSLYKDLGNNTYIYDDKGNLTYCVLEDKNIEAFKYDKNNQLISSFDPLGNNLKYEYDNGVIDRLIGGISPTGISNKMKYDSNGNIVKTVIKNTYVDLENTSNYCLIRAKGTNSYLSTVFKKLEVKLKEDSCSNDTWLLEKVNEGYKIKHPIIDKFIVCNSPNVVVDNFDSDKAIYNIIRCDNGSVVFNLVNTNKYLYITDGVLSVKELSNDVKFDDDNTIQFYLENTINSHYIKNEALYSEDGKVMTKMIDSLDNTTEFDINPLNNLVNKVKDANGHETKYYYDDKERVKRISKENILVDYKYNDNNLLEKITTDGKEYNFTYDEFLNQKEVAVGNSKLITNNYLENNGKLASSVYGNGNTINFTYDNFERISKVVKMDDTYKYNYNNLGDLGRIEANNDEYKYNYDFAKRLKRYEYNDYQIKYNYDNKGNVINRNYDFNFENNNISYEYNQEGTITKLGFLNKNVDYKYDDLGRIIEINLENVYKKTYKYVNKGKKTSTLIDTETIGNTVYEYKYDKLNNIKEIRKNGNIWKKYYYDLHSQLIRDDDYERQITTRYLYDAAGNILYKKEFELNTYNIYKKTNYSYDNLEWRDQLTRYKDKEITYDEIGNPITFGDNITMSWINGRSLSNYSDTSKNLEISYKYNKDGIRKEKLVNGDLYKYYVEGNKIIFEKRNNNMLYYIRDNNGNLIGFKYNNKQYYYITNMQNDVIAIMNSNNELEATYEYDSFGKIISIKDKNGNDVSNDLTHIANINPFRYRSYYYDNETELYYLNSRYYNPEIGRFINVDCFVSTGQGLLGNNMYAYCNNNYVNYVDSFGCTSQYAAIGAGIFDAIFGADNSDKSKITSSLKKSENINKLPTVGKPNSKLKKPNGDSRYYGPDGRATTDIDYSHPTHHPDLPNPHAHDWSWDEDGNPSRGPAHDPDAVNIVVGTTVTVGLGYLIYRIARMVPSLIPGFWWTIPINAATP